jgi:hypothetical protein
MSTTLPTRDRDRTTASEPARSFDQAPPWDVDDEKSDPGTREAMSLVEEKRTTPQAFERAAVLRRRYLKDWRDERRPRFTLKQEWIGRVDEVREETFVATLVTREAPGEVEHAEIDIEEVAPTELKRLRPGAVFYWVIGYRDEPHGQRLGVSSILFRKMADPTSEQVEMAHDEAERALALFEAAHEASSNGSS